MTLTKKWHFGMIIGAIDLLFIFAFIYMILSGVFVDDKGLITGEGFGAVLIIIFTIIAIGCAFVHYTFDEDGLDTSNLSQQITIPCFRKKYVVLFGFVVFFIYLLSLVPKNGMIRMYNDNIAYTHQFEMQQYDRKMYYDKMWKTYLDKNSICELNRETFIEVTSLIMQGRSDGEQIAWKFIHENQQIPYQEFSKFYMNLTNFVQQQREGYYALEKQCMSTVRAQNCMIDSFPNCLYNQILKIEPLMYYPGVVGAYTDDIFMQGVD